MMVTRSGYQSHAWGRAMRGGGQGGGRYPGLMFVGGGAVQ